MSLLKFKKHKFSLENQFFEVPIKKPPQGRFFLNDNFKGFLKNMFMKLYFIIEV